MDAWRRKLERRNRARARWKRPSASPIRIDKWVKIALVTGGIVVIAWFMTDDGVINLREEEPTPVSPAVTQATDGYDLYRRAQYDAAFDQLLPLADRGDGQAQCVIGKILVRGLGGVAADHVDGIKWLDLCLRNPDYEGDDEARDLIDDTIKIAGWEIVGEGRYRAFQWQQAHINTQNGEPGSASERVLRDLGAMGGHEAFVLGVDLDEGNNLPVDYAKALECFRRAAEFDIPEAAFNVGLAYYAGKGVKADPVEAMRWLKIASDNGFAQAATLLGIMTARGHGTGQDIEAALAYLQRGAELGDPAASLIGDGIAGGEIPK